MLTSGKAIWYAVTLLLPLAAVLSPAVADVSSDILTITASNGRSEATVCISLDDAIQDGDDYFWSIAEPLELRDASDMLLGTFGPANLALYADPQVSLGFAVQASDVDTTFTITSALLSFDPIAAGLARADAALTLQDFWGDGALLTGNGPSGGAYLTQYNGFVPGGTTFGEGIAQIAVTPPSLLQTAEYFSAPGGEWLPISAVSDMSSQFAFTLSPLALASGSANFEVIIPEPTALLLLSVGLLAVRRR